jgi:dienelactone hydrolase
MSPLEAPLFSLSTRALALSSPILACALLSACDGGGASDDTDADTDVAVSCAPVMPSLEWDEKNTGFNQLELSYDVRWSGDTRTIPWDLWYPTDATTGVAAAYRDAFADPYAFVDAPFADPAPGCKLPLVVYSHGSQAWGGNTSPILRHLVAQGWVAAAPDHLGNTLDNNVEPRPITYSMTRVEDVRATIDAIEALPEDHPLHGRVDTSKVLVMGHSFGGQTSWLLAGPTLDTAAIVARCDADPTQPECEYAADAYAGAVDDPRVAAVLPLDGTAGQDLVADAGWATATRPILMLSQSSSNPDDSAFTHAALAAEVTWVQVAGSCHESFTSTALPCPGLDKTEGLQITGRFVTAFAATQILGLQDAHALGVLDGTQDVSEKLTILRHTSP